MAMVATASANTALNFQQPADFTGQVECAGACSWVESTTGGNNYIDTFGSGVTVGIISTSAQPMTYSAITLLPLNNANAVNVNLLDGSKASIWSYQKFQAGLAIPGRYEIKIIGGVAYFYRNGVEITHSGALGTNPSYIRWSGGSNWGAGWGDGYIDDVVWGSSEPLSDTASDKYVYGVPETASDGSPYYLIMKDMLNPAASGFYFGNGTLISSTALPSTFSKGNNNNDTINLQGYTTGVNVLSYSTGTARTGTITWNLTQFFAANPDYGLYAMHSPSSLKYSDLILYTGHGATISWNQDTYSQGDTGAILTVVTDGGYWDPATYNYRVDVLNIFGVVDATYPVTTQTQTISHTWDTDQPIGVYYAAIIATPKTGTSPADDIWMAVALTNVDAYLTLHGYVLNAENATAISGANVNITQGLTINNVATPSDGNYSVTGLSQGATIAINVSKTGYQTYYHQFTPLRIGSLELNFTLIPTSPTFTGTAIGGLALEPPYNRTISSATIELQNATDYNSTTTNTVGYFIKNDLTTAKAYTVHGSKTGFTNSSNYVLTTAAGWNRQDVLMNGAYILTVNFQDSVTHAPIPVVNVIDSIGGNVNTTTGTFTGTYNYSVVVLYISSSGYQSTSRSYVMDEDRSATVYLTVAPPVPTIGEQQNTLWSPPQVVFQVLDNNNNPIVGTPVYANAEFTTMPGGLTGALALFANSFGLSNSTASTILNQSTSYYGTTDTSGSVVFMMIPVISYNVTARDTNGVNYTISIMPKDQYYQIKTQNASFENQAIAQITYETAIRASIFNTTFYEPPNGTIGIMGSQIYDSTNHTNGANCWWKLIDNQTTWWDNRTWAYGSGLQIINKTVPIVPYQQWQWGCATV